MAELYLNTLIFCLVAKSITVLILVSLVFKPVRKFSYLILTIELGLVAIIIYSLYSMKKYENQMKTQYDNIMNAPLSINSCPDYFVKDVQNDQTICNNSYTTPDGKFTYTFGDSTTNTVNIDTTFGTDSSYTDACGKVNTLPFTGFAWTDLSSKCAIL